MSESSFRQENESLLTWSLRIYEDRDFIRDVLTSVKILRWKEGVKNGTE